MSFILTYRPICDVQLWHGYFLQDASQPSKYIFELTPEEQAAVFAQYDIRSFLDIKPTLETQEKLINAKMVFRTTSLGFKIFASVNSDEETLFIEPDDFFNLSFAISPKDNLLQNYSNIHLEEGAAAKTMYLSNTHQNKMGETLFLSREIDAFDGGETYFTGDYVAVELGGNPAVQEAKQNNPGTPGAAAPNWESLPAFQYVQRSDRLKLLSRTFRIDFSSLGVSAAQLRLTRPGDNVVVLDEELKYIDGRALDDFLVEIPDVPEGKYEMTLSNGGTVIPSLSTEIFLSDEVKPGTFGIIELIHSTGLGEFALLDNGKLLDDVNFLAFIPNRRTFWRYIFKESDSINPGAGFTSEANNKVISDSLKPLTRAYQPTIVEQDGRNVPNPATNLIKPESISGKIISETYIL